MTQADEKFHLKNNEIRAKSQILRANFIEILAKIQFLQFWHEFCY